VDEVVDVREPVVERHDVVVTLESRTEEIGGEVAVEVVVVLDADVRPS
jgi:hypothetical protein